MQNKRHHSFGLSSFSRLALLAVTIGASSVVVGCGSKQESASDATPTGAASTATGTAASSQPAASSPAASGAPGQSVHTPAEQAAILKQAQDDKDK